MARVRSIIPDLDALDSPLLSSTSFIGFGGVPGSAIAEKIFNDPESWDDTSGEEEDYPVDVDNEAVAWFTEEIEKLKRSQSGSRILEDDFTLLTRVEKGRSRKDNMDIAPKRDGNAGWNRRGGVRPISLAGLFEQSTDEFSMEIQQHLSKILDSGGIKHHIGSRPPSSSIIPPPFLSSTLNTPTTADTSIYTPQSSSSAADPSNPPSATLNFLEYYGIYPDSPKLDRKLLRKMTGSRSTRRRKDSGRRFNVPSTAPPLPPPAKRHAFPPGLESAQPPTRYDQSPTRSRNNNAKTSDQDASSYEADISPRNRPLPITTGPFTPPTTTTDTPSVSPIRVRRLPSIPSEPLARLSVFIDPQPTRSRTPTPPLSIKPASVTTTTTNVKLLRHGTPPPRSNSTLPLLSLSGGGGGGFGSTVSSSSVRSPPMVRSPMGVPLGPRNRSTSSTAAPDRRMVTSALLF